jgi:hypothetical protein
MAKALKHVPGEPDESSAEERQRKAERMGAFYRSSPGESSAAATGTTTTRLAGLTEVGSIFRSEFNTVSYLAIGLSLIALLAISVLFFRPPKPEAELRILAETQTQNQAALEQLTSQMTALSRQAVDDRQSELTRTLRLTAITLGVLRAQGSPEVRAEAESLQARIEGLLGELEREP